MKSRKVNRQVTKNPRTGVIHKLTGKTDLSLQLGIFARAGVLVYPGFYFAGIFPIGENRTQKLSTFLHQNQICAYGRSHFYR
jgi:hypothetical protein